ncbi:MAG: gephyrin-like molybdotransferase Glp [Microcoleaceae cyanobacterium]
MLPVNQAESIILNLVQPFTAQDIEWVELSAAMGRILAESISSKLDFPHWDNSAMDGYAVRHQDIQNCHPKNPKTLEIVEEIPAGYQPQKTIQSGQAARIFTGACLPAGADTIIMQEDTQRQGNSVQILAAAKPQAFVRHQGSFYQAGSVLLTPGIVLKAAEIAVLAAAQCCHVPVYRRVKVAIFSTGNELVKPNQPLQPGQIVDSNHYALMAWVQSMNMEPISLGIVPDQPEILKNTINQAIETADIVLSTGGVSVGDYDYIEQILNDLGGDIQVSSVAIKPGKPLTVAKFASCIYFGLPGNPVSALVTCWRFVQPAIKKQAGLLPQFYQPKFVKARLRQDLHSGGKRETYCWGQLHWVEDGYEFESASGRQNSANLINLAQTTALGIIPVNQTLISQGEWVQVLLID